MTEYKHSLALNIQKQIDQSNSIKYIQIRRKEINQEVEKLIEQIKSESNTVKKNLEIKISSLNLELSKLELIQNAILSQTKNINSNEDYLAICAKGKEYFKKKEIKELLDKLVSKRRVISQTRPDKIDIIDKLSREIDNIELQLLKLDIKTSKIIKKFRQKYPTSLEKAKRRPTLRRKVINLTRIPNTISENEDKEEEEEAEGGGRPIIKTQAIRGRRKTRKGGKN